jgi:hypothetical protein
LQSKRLLVLVLVLDAEEVELLIFHEGLELLLDLFIQRAACTASTGGSTTRSRLLLSLAAATATPTTAARPDDCLRRELGL